MDVLSLSLFRACGVVSTVQQGWSQGILKGRGRNHGRMETLAKECLSLYSSSTLITTGFLGEGAIRLMVC